jgi:hypothetical protein
MPQASAARDARARAAPFVVAVCALALVGVAALSAKLLLLDRRTATPPLGVASSKPPSSIPLGESFDGVELPRDDVRVVGSRTGLSVRQGCAWGVPGRHPYGGTVTQALLAARLPEDVVRRIDVMIALGIVSDQVVISRDSIRAVRSSRQFDSKIVAMGFGNTLCFGTRVNFQPGHLEFADLYDATDGRGNNYSVMVPYVCGNVSVLAERAERDDGAVATLMPVPGAATGATGHPRGLAVPGSPGGRVTNLAKPAEQAVRTVPEPGTLAGLIAALAAMALAEGIARRRRSALTKWAQTSASVRWRRPSGSFG